MEARKNTQVNLQLLRELLDSGGLRSAGQMIQSLHPAEVAHLLESVPHGEIALVDEVLAPQESVVAGFGEHLRDGRYRVGKTLVPLLYAVGIRVTPGQ